MHEKNGRPRSKCHVATIINVQVAGSIGDFEKVFEDMDVKTHEMNGALDNVYSAAIDNNEVNNLLNEMRDQVSMSANDQMKAGRDMINPAAVPENDMEARLANVKNL